MTSYDMYLSSYDRKDAALDAARRNLSLYFKMKAFYSNSSSVLDWVKSNTTSLIVVNPDLNTSQSSSIERGALNKAFCEYYEKIFSSLDDVYQKTLIDYYTDEHLYMYHDGKYYDRLEAAFEMTALLDDDIPYTIQDYQIIRDYKGDGEVSFSTIKECMYVLLAKRPGLLTNPLGLDASDRNNIYSVLHNCVPNLERQILISFVLKRLKNETLDFTRSERRCLKRGLITLALIYEGFDLSEDNAINLLSIDKGSNSYLNQIGLITARG